MGMGESKMKLGLDNVYLVKKDNQYIIHIGMPDGSKNYLHCQPFDLYHAIMYRDNLIGLEIDKDSIQVNEDETYYRLYMPILVGETADVELKFHSRKLNLNDVIYERMQIST